MNQPLYEAFVGSHFDPLFSSAAAFAGAEDSAALNVPALHAEARSGIMKVASNAARAVSDATTRILLIDGDAGFGKTHVLTSTLFKLARDGDVLPTAFQLSADIGEDEIVRRLLRATIRELEARHFRDANGSVPLRHLATSLIELADHDREAFDKAVADFDEEAAATEALKAAASIVRALERLGHAPPDDHLIAAILLTAERVGSGARQWLLGYSPAQIGPLVLPPFENESDYFDVILAISILGASIDAPLLLAFDQVEAALAAGSEVLVTRVVTQACQLAELSPSIGVVFAALSGTFPGTVLPRLHASIRDRIQLPPSQPIHLKAPDVAILRAVVDRRCEELVRRSGIKPHPNAGRIMVPTWLIEQHTGQSIRELFREIRDYRELCRALGRFADASEFSASRPAALTPSDDFDKLWENAKDRDIGAVAVLTDHERAKMFMELLRKIPAELAHVSRTEVSQTDSNKRATRIVEVTFFDNQDAPMEKWAIAFADEPNSQGQFRDQLHDFLDRHRDGQPAIIRRRPIPGVKEGRPRRERDLANLQAGPAIRRLFESDGRAAYAPDQDWARLRLALEFCRQRGDAVGFLEWRKERRFLLEAAVIGEMTQLLQPSQTPDDQRTPRSGSSSAMPATPARDPRDSATFFLGYAPDKRRILWDLDRTSKPLLPNFGLMVSGDPQQGKTQLVKALIAEAVGVGCPALIFDYAGDFVDSKEDAFATDNGINVVDLKSGLPFNPLRVPPRGAKGSQPIEHVFEVTGILRAALSLNEQQTAILRSAIEIAFRKLKVPLREWVDPNTTPAPSFADVIAAAKDEYDQADPLIQRVAPLLDDRLLPSDAEASGPFSDLLGQRTILNFDGLPRDNALKRALTELVLLHAQANMMRGETPRALRRLIVMDEAGRAAESDRLIALAREGHPYGVALVTMAQHADEVGTEVAASLATKVHFYNAEPRRRRRVVQSTYGTTSSRAARDLLSLLGGLREYDGILRSPQHAPFERLTIEPYDRRRGDDE